MKKIIRIVKRRWVLGTLIILTIGFVLAEVFPLYSGSIGYTMGGFLFPIWWIYCFFTRNRKRKGDDYESLPE